MRNRKDSEMQNATDNRHPGDAEAAAAIAALAETYGGYQPAIGDRVRCPLAFGGGYQQGVVVGPDRDGWLVDTAEGRLLLYAEELVQN
jgi:streptogramin lyase